MKVSVYLSGIAVLVSLSPSAAFAQDAPEASEIVITAPLEGARIESLQGAEVLRREDIVENLNGGLGDTLDATPGIATTFFGAGASRPIIRGLGEDRVRVLQNGIGAIDASTASPDHAVTSDGLDAERIEILRGAAALAYGGNAIGGVVNVIDQSIPTRAVDGVEAEGLVGYSTVNEGTDAAANVAFGAGPWALRFSASGRQTDDYEIPGPAEAHEQEEEEEEEHEESEGVAPNSWTDLRAYALGGSIVQDWGFLGLAVKRTETEYGLPGHGHEDGEEEEEEGEEIPPRIELEQTRIEARGDFRIDWGAFDRLDFAIQHSDYEHTEFEEGGEAGTVFTSEGWEARVEGHHRSGALQGAIGLQVSDVDLAAEGEEAFISATNTQDTGVFIVERWDRGIWGLEGGARFERRELDNEVFGARDFDNVSASLGAFLRPAEGWFLGATLAHTERAPTGIELFSDGPHLATANYEIGDVDLGQETALSFEISTRYQNDRFSFEMNIFAIEFDDYIALVNRGDFWYVDEDLPDDDPTREGFVNDEADAPPGADETLPVFNFVQQDAIFVGGEILARALLFEAGGFALSGDLAFDTVNAGFDGGGSLPRIPPRTLTLGLEAENANWTARIEGVDVAEQDRVAAFETPTDGYTFLNASLAFRPSGESGPWTIRLDGRNLTDELGRVHSSVLKDELPLPGRNVRLTLLASF
jgi:iron complex outermembrane receptor protein